MMLVDVIWLPCKLWKSCDLGLSVFAYVVVWCENKTRHNCLLPLFLWINIVQLYWNACDILEKERNGSKKDLRKGFSNVTNSIQKCREVGDRLRGVDFVGGGSKIALSHW